MTQISPIDPFDGPTSAIADHRRQSRGFSVKSRQYLSDDDLHQASEKGWGAAAWMAKAVAEAQGGNTGATKNSPTYPTVLVWLSEIKGCASYEQRPTNCMGISILGNGFSIRKISA